MKRWRQQSSFFPSTHDILEIYKVLRSERNVSDVKALPMPTEISEEQAALNLKHIAKLRDKIGLPMSKVLTDGKCHAQQVKQQAYDILYKQRGF